MDKIMLEKIDKDMAQELRDIHYKLDAYPITSGADVVNRVKEFFNFIMRENKSEPDLMSVAYKIDKKINEAVLKANASAQGIDTANLETNIEYSKNLFANRVSVLLDVVVQARAKRKGIDINELKKEKENLKDKWMELTGKEYPYITDGKGNEKIIRSNSTISTNYQKVIAINEKENENKSPVPSYKQCDVKMDLSHYLDNENSNVFKGIDDVLDKEENTLNIEQNERVSDAACL